MAENVTIARPYAEAVFQLAKGKKKALDSWVEGLKALSQVVADPAVQACVTDPNLSGNKIKVLLTDIVKDLDGEQQNFVQLLIDNHRLLFLPEICQLVVARRNAQSGVKVAVVTSAFALDKAEVGQLKKDLEEFFGCKLEIEVEINPDLIGGIIIAVGDEVIDASVRGKLASMAIALKN